MSAERPPHPGFEPAEGFEWKAEPRANWRLVTGKRCRQIVGAVMAKHGCGKPAVAEINRRVRRGGVTHDSWWAYCEDHLREYGNWIEDGQVMSWNLQPIGGAS